MTIKGFSKRAPCSLSAKGRKPQLIYQPGPRGGSVESVATGNDKLYASITDNVIGAVHVFTTGGPQKNGNSVWHEKDADTAGAGARLILSRSTIMVPKAMFMVPRITSLPPRCTSTAAMTRPKPSNPCPPASMPQTSPPNSSRPLPKDGAKIPYFVTRPRNRFPAPAPTLLYGYGGFEISHDAHPIPPISAASGSIMAASMLWPISAVAANSVRLA